MTTAFSYNAEQAAAADAGGGNGLSTSVVTRGWVRKARWKMSTSSQAEMLELTFETEQGQTVNYLNLVYKDKNGAPLEFGEQRIHALMGCTGVQSLSRQQAGSESLAPELKDKPVALALERRNTIKGDGSETWGHDIKAIMSAKSWLTINEHQNGKQAESKAYWESEFAKMPQGKPAKQPNNGGGQYGVYAAQSYNQAPHGKWQPPADDPLDSEIPF